MRLHVLDTGYCLAHEHHVRRQAPRRRIHCHALVALFEHPTEGWVLFDTGYAPRFIEMTRRFPNRLYRLLVPTVIHEHDSVLRQLPRFGLSPSDIRWIIISHFHADHVAGLLDFPQAKFICTRTAYEHFKMFSGWSGLRRAYINSLVPDDFAKRARWIESFSGEALPGLGNTHDLFDDGTARLMPLPGHARGQIGAWVATVDQPTLLAADGCWQRASIRTQDPPHWLTHAFIDDAREVRQTLAKLHQFHQAQPDATIVPTHCPEAYAELVVRQSSDSNDAAPRSEVRV